MAQQDADNQRRFQAAMTANLLNCWVKQPVSIDDLLGTGSARPRRRRKAAAVPLSLMSEQEREAMIEQILAGKAGKKKRGSPRL